MGVRRTSNVNLVLPYGRWESGGGIPITIEYRKPDKTGRPQPWDPDTIEAIVYAPDGTQRIYRYPVEEGYGEITRFFEGRYGFGVLGNIKGKWRIRVLTADGAAPSEEVEFEVS